MSKRFGIIALALGLVGFAMKCAAIFTYDGWLAAEFPDLLHKWNYFGFFTYTTNIMVDTWLVLLGVSLLFAFDGLKRRLTKASLQGFLTAMIFVVGALYCFTMFWFDEPYSWGLWWGNVVTFWHHVATPVIMIIVFFRSKDRKKLGKKDLALWMIYPFMYLLVTMLRGSIASWYPYPFLDPAWDMFTQMNLRPWTGVTLACAFIFFFMLATAVLTVRIHNWLATKRK